MSRQTERAKYCVHYSVGGSQWHDTAGSLASAKTELQRCHDAFGFQTITHEKYYQCDTALVSRYCRDCTDRENHHDYPAVIYRLTTRGNIRRENT